MENPVAEACQLIRRIISQGHSHGHIADIFGADLAKDMIVFLSVNSRKYLIEFSDYWESINEPVPAEILIKMRQEPELKNLVNWIDKEGNGNW